MGVASEAVQRAGRRAFPAGTVVRWLGHSTVLIEMDGVRLLTDPVLRNRIGHLVRIAPPDRSAELGDLDSVLLSHLHADHADVPSLRALPRVGSIVAPPPARDWLTGHDLGAVTEVAVGETIAVGTVRVRAVQAEHDGRRWPLGPTADTVGFLVQGTRNIYFAGDTDVFAGMEELRGSVDLALLPIWGWGRRVPAGHLDPERATEAVTLIRPTVVVPIHWGTLALPRALRARSDPADPPREFARLVHERAPDVEVRILSPGTQTTL